MHIGELTAPEQRVLGCLIEKRFTTPDQYPLTLNALRLACNQSTNRDPVVHYDEDTIREAAQRLSRYGVARLASGHSSRSVKYRHLAEEALGVDQQQLAILCVLLLRGPQTPGELKGRTERMVRFDSLAAVEAVLDSLAQRGQVRRLERRPGQKEDRYEQLLGGPGAGASVPAGMPNAAPPVPVRVPDAAPVPVRMPDAAPAYVREGGAPVAGQSPSPATAPIDSGLAARVDALEAEVAGLRAELTQLRELFD